MCRLSIMFICIYHLLFLDDFQRKCPVRPGNLLNPCHPNDCSVLRFFLCKLQEASQCVSQWHGNLATQEIQSLRVWTSCQTVQIGARPMPQKRNVFCLCFSFQIQCFCGFFINFVQCFVFLAPTRSSLVHLSVHGQR